MVKELGGITLSPEEAEEAGEDISKIKGEVTVAPDKTSISEVTKSVGVSFRRGRRGSGRVIGEAAPAIIPIAQPKPITETLPTKAERPPTFAEEKIGSFRDIGRPTELGMLTLTAQEREQIGIPSVPFRVVEDSDIKGVTGEIEKSQFIGQQVELKPQLFGTAPMEAFVSGQAQIIKAEETFERIKDIRSQIVSDPRQFIGDIGVTETDEAIEFKPEFFESKLEGVGLTAREQAESLFAQRPVSSRLLAGGLEASVAGTQLALGIGEFGISQFGRLGMQLEEPGKPSEETFGIKTGFGTGFRFRGVLGDIKQQPSGVIGITTKVATILPVVPIAIKGGISLVKEVGVKGAVIEAAGAFSPFQIRPQVFSFKIDKKAIIDAKAITSRGTDFTQRVITGKGGGGEFDIFSKQLIKGRRSLQITDISGPATEFRLGFPTGFKEFTRVVRFEGFGVGTGGAVRAGRQVGGITTLDDILSGTQGFRGDIIVGKRADLLFQFRDVGPSGAEIIGVKGRVFPAITEAELIRTGGFVTKVGKRVSFFGAGRGQTQFRTRIDGDLIVREPTSKFRVPKITLRGTEFDITGFGGVSVSKIPTGAGRTITSGKQLQKSLQEGVGQITASLSKVAPVVQPPIPKISVVPAITGLSQVTDTKTTQQLVSPITIPKIREEFKSAVMSRVEPAQVTRQQARLRTGLGLVTSTTPALRQQAKLLQKQATRLRQKQKQQLEFARPVESFFGEVAPFEFGTGFGLLGGFVLPPLLIGDVIPKERKAERKLKRIPTFAAVTLGRTTKAPSITDITGISEIVPIKKGRKK